jgi:hypothetical protein
VEYTVGQCKRGLGWRIVLHNTRTGYGPHIFGPYCTRGDADQFIGVHCGGRDSDYDAGVICQTMIEARAEAIKIRRARD